MIGGEDIVIERGNADRSLLFEAIAQATSESWPALIVQDAATGDTYASIRDVPFGALSEMILYRDASSEEAWRTDGATEENYETMIHVLVGDNSVTVVVGENRGEISMIVERLMSVVDGLPRELRAA
jgi:hypothetical protein